MEPQELIRQRQEFEAKLKAIGNEDDPLSVYVQFVEWIVNNYGEQNKSSGLASLLGKATSAFKHDSLYKTDLRYLKLWTLYARQLERPRALLIYTSLLKRGIGTSYSLLYEEYANVLEADGKISEATRVYTTGIERHARPLERLKIRYVEFQKRNSFPATKSPSASRTGSAHASGSSKSPPSPHFSSAAARYALMMAPPASGKRPEKFMFDLSLLYTEENGEFCYQEVRARTMGLWRKKWPPVSPDAPIPDAVSEDEDETVPLRKKNLMNREPTVTINTKEALADVFGMYNSPEKTVKVRAGSKHAQTKKVDTFTPARPQNENSQTQKPSTQAFRPFVDEDLPPRKENQSQTKFTPYVDPDTKTPRAALVEKFTPYVDTDGKTPRVALADKSENKGVNVFKPKPITEEVLSKVFSPAQTTLPPLAPLREAFTDDYGKPQVRPAVHERAKSQHDIPSLSSTDNRTPFKVFSKPTAVDLVFTPKTPSIVPAPAPSELQPRPALKPQSPELLSSENSRSNAVVGFPNDNEEEENSLDHSQHQELEDEDHYDDSYDAAEDYEVLIPASEESQYQSIRSFREPPLGGRFGQFNVMTPITERTFEFTTSTRGGFDDTPSDRLHRVSEDDETTAEGAAMLAEDDTEQDRENDDASSVVKPFLLPSQQPNPVDVIEEQTGKLSLSDALTLSSNFRPPNPCNPFDSSILATLLSRLPSDTHYHDLRNQEANQLDALERFTKKTRKTSGNSTTGDFASSHPLSLDGRKYLVSTKLGEGGFGSVFQAQDLGLVNDEDDDNEDDDFGEDEVTLVAIKVVKPRNLWEYHVLRRLHSVLPFSVRCSVVLPHALFAFRDESFLILDLCPQGPLLDIVNKAGAAGVAQQGACLDELLVVFFTIELLRLLEVMHSIGFIHGDLKIDNCLLRLEEVPGGPSSWSSDYSPTGEGGWAHKGLKVIDFGRTIDTRLFPPDQCFVADWAIDERDCFEIQEGKSWTFQTDYFGLASIIYCMLFGKYIQKNSIHVVADRRKIATPFKRYWQTEMWNQLFDLLLNPCSVGQLPLTREVGMIREEMETWLKANCNRTTGTLKGLLKKVELACLQR